MVNRDTLLLTCGTCESRTELRHIFENSYNLLEADNIRQARLLLEQNHCCIAAILVDASASDKTNLEDLTFLTRNENLPRIPVLVLTASDSSSMHQHILDLGASDVTRAPYSPTILRHRLQNITDLYLHRLHLEELVDEQARALQQATEAMVGTLSSVIEHRNTESGQHVLRIRHFTQILLDEVARSFPEYGLDEETVQIIASASSLHDIGKIAIPDSILTKPDHLTPEENAIMQTHTTVGCRILDSLNGSTSKEYLRYAYEICRCHHERWDGYGYPDGICGDDIPISAQVVGLADAYDALTSKRAYKEAFSLERSTNMILNGECGTFSPKLLECFKRVNHQFSTLAQKYADGHDPKAMPSASLFPNLVVDNDLEPLRLTQAKYQSILHYLNVAVFEVDFDQSTYRLVYNPDPNLAFLNTATSFDELVQAIEKDLIIPKDTHYLKEVIRHDIPAFFQNGLRYQHAYFHIKNLTASEPLLYQMTLLRIDPPNSPRRRAILLWQEYSHSSTQHSKNFNQNFLDFTVLGTLDTLYSVYYDQWLTFHRPSKDLLYQLGYTRDELMTRYQNQMIQLIHPDDRQRTLTSISQQLAEGIDFVTEFRLLHKAGHYIWMLSKGRLVRKHNGQEHLFAILVDISKSKATEEFLQQTLERQAIILSQSENVIFECNMDGSEAVFTEKWETIFGYPPMTRNIKELLTSKSPFHPEDVPRVLTAYQALQHGSAYQKVDLRVAKADGCYLWCQARITVQYDRDNHPLKLVGVLVNIDEVKRATQALQDRADRDALTNLLNKGAGQMYAEAYLDTLDGDSSAALIIIDLDNFKQVNDQYGHLLGDIIISQAACEIKKLFRSDDIIARVGGDEFMVLMKNIPSLNLLQNRLDRLMTVFHTVLYDRVPEANLGCSVGVSLCPQHGVKYEDLFHHADQALYQVKGHGKNGYMLYDANSPTFQGQRRGAAATTPIDSDKKDVFTLDTLIHYAFSQLYSSGNVEQTIKKILSLVGKRLNVCRVYIFENNADNTRCSNTFEWCNEGITAEIDQLQNLSYQTQLLDYEKNFNDRGIFYCPDVSTIPKAQYDVFAPMGVKSMLQCSIRDNGVFRGFVGFDACNTNRLWTQQQIDMLTFFSEMLSVFLLKKRAQDETIRRAENLESILENQHAWICVIDTQTYELVFLNEKLKSAFPDTHVGMSCYNSLIDQEQPCPGCPIHQQAYSNKTLHVRSKKMDLHIFLEAAPIKWNGRDARLITCRNIDTQTSSSDGDTKTWPLSSPQ